MKIINIVEDILIKFVKSKTDSAEVYIIEESSTAIEVKEQKVDSFQSAASRGFALRVLLGNKLGFSYTSDNSPPAIERLIKEAFENAENNESDVYISFAKPSQGVSVKSLYDDKLKGVGEKEKIERGMKLERAALQYDKRIKKIRHASYEDSENKKVFLNSNGIKSFYSDTVCSTSIMLVEQTVSL